MGVVIGVLISWLTWPSRELEPRRADVLLILVFVWSGCTLPIAQRARGPVAWGKEDEVLPGSQQDAVPFGNKGIVCLESLQILGPEASPTLGAGRNAKLSRTKVLGVGPSTKHSLLKFVSLEGLVEAETEVELPQSRPAVAADSARDVCALLWARVSLFCARVKRFVPAIPWAALGKLAAWPLVWLSGLVPATVYTDWLGEETRTRKSGTKTRSLRTPQRLGLRL
ncbi:armadillo repeat-containing X-linked protein 1 isoform X4 [Pan troglodytes]|uniref:armadillo repeat-containing X-linked protein 1 isoform X4 n=1 Tax=Pan troglodytes TaxID=9598 RepID=UPI003013BB41